MTVCKSRLCLKAPTSQRTPHAVVSATRPERAWLDKSTSTRYICLVASLVACPCRVHVAKDAWCKSPWTT